MEPDGEQEEGIEAKAPVSPERQLAVPPPPVTGACRAEDAERNADQHGGQERKPGQPQRGRQSRSDELGDRFA